MSKKTNLAAALHEASGKKMDMIVKSEERTPTILTVKSPGRIGKRIISGHFDPAVTRQLKLLAINHDTTIQNMLTEALNDLFEKHNMKPIA